MLCKGIEDYKVTTESREEKLDNGASILHRVSTRIPYRRDWMKVTEILEQLEEEAPHISITKHQCYYHLQKLADLEMVEQFPPDSYDDGGKRQRSRDKQYRASARFFISCLRGITPEVTDEILDILDDGWKVTTQPEDTDRLKEIFLIQDEIILRTIEDLAQNLIDTPSRFMQLPYIMEQLSWILLSENVEFIQLQKEARRILLRSDNQLHGSLSSDQVQRQKTTHSGVKEFETNGN